MTFEFINRFLFIQVCVCVCLPLGRVVVVGCLGVELGSIEGVRCSEEGRREGWIDGWL